MQSLRFESFDRLCIPSLSKESATRIRRVFRNARLRSVDTAKRVVL